MSQDAFEARKGIGLLGGTFDPIHQGHLALAASALEQLKLQQIDFLLAPRPWQKSVLTSVTDRARMIEQAIRGNPRLKLNLTEVFRPGLTYTIDTLKALREKLGGNPVPLVLLMGQDQWANLKTWKSWQALTRTSRFSTAERSVSQFLRKSPPGLREKQCRPISSRLRPQAPSASFRWRRMKRIPPRSESFLQSPPHCKMQLNLRVGSRTG